MADGPDTTSAYDLWSLACGGLCQVEDIAAATGLTVDQVDRVFRDIDQKRKAMQHLHLGPELAADVPEISYLP